MHVSCCNQPSSSSVSSNQINCKMMSRYITLFTVISKKEGPLFDNVIWHTTLQFFHERHEDSRLTKCLFWLFTYVFTTMDLRLPHVHLNNWKKYCSALRSHRYIAVAERNNSQKALFTKAFILMCATIHKIRNTSM